MTRHARHIRHTPGFVFYLNEDIPMTGQLQNANRRDFLTRRTQRTLRITLAIFALFLAAGVCGAEDPLELTASADTSISDQEIGQPAESDGKRATIRMMAGKEQHRILMSFELKDQAARPCLSATLRLTTDKCWPGSKSPKIRVQRLVRPFTERWGSWNYGLEYEKWINAGGDFDPNSAAVRKFVKKDDGEGKVIDIDVTALVQGWQTRQFTNYGMLLALDDDETNVHFHSREASDAAKRPKLLLYYGAAPPKNAEMLPVTSIKPLGKEVVMKIAIQTTSMTKGITGAAYKTQLVVGGGLPPYKWKITGLPDGITSTDDGLLTGTPAKEGKFPLTLTATGADQKSATLKLTLEVDEPSKPVADNGKDAPPSVNGLLGDKDKDKTAPPKGGAKKPDIKDE